MAALEVRLLGSPDIRVGGAPLEVDTRKAVALLAYLAVDRNIHGREALAALLWPEYDRESARAALRRTLSNLRRGLGGRWLTVARDAIGLDNEDPGAIFVDTQEFESLIARAEGHGHGSGAACSECERALSDASAHVRGDFMSGFSVRDSVPFEEWQLFQGDHFRTLLAGALDRLAQSLAAAGKPDAAIAVGRRRLGLDPLHEPAHRLLMTLYADTGRRSNAIQQFRECVAVLDRELGVAPLAETTELYSAIMEDRIEAHATADSKPPVLVGAKPRPFRGRGQHLSQMRAVYDGLTDRPELIALEGEAGVGKTRCAEEFLRELEGSRATTLVARCYEDEVGLPFAPIAEALRIALARDPSLLNRLPSQDLGEVARLLPDLVDVQSTESPDDPSAHSRFISSMSRALVEACNGAASGAIFVDDLQWADPSTLEVLGWLLRRTVGSPLLLIAAYRNDDALATHRLRRRLRVSFAIQVSRLTEAQVVELVEATQLGEKSNGTELGARIYRETEGLPLFVVEYLSSLEAQGPEIIDWDWPEGMRDVIRDRVAAAGDVARQLLAAAAVVGRSFDFDIVREASGRTVDESVVAIEELVARGILRALNEEPGSAPMYDFSHEKIRALIYEDTNLVRRRLLHGRTADALIRRRYTVSNEERLWLAIATHCRLAGRERDAAHYYALAGEHSRTVFANTEALAHFKSALALGHTDSSLIHEAIGDLQTLSGDYGAALASYETGAGLRGPGVPILEHKLGRVHHRRGDWRSAASHYRAALVQLGAEEYAARSRTLSDLSLTTHHAGDDEAAGEFAAQALELSDVSGDDRARAQAHNVLGILAAAQQDLDGALHHLGRSRSLAQSSGDHGAEVAALNNLALTLRAGGRYDDALELTRASLRICEMQGDRHREAALHNNIADLLQTLDRPDEAMTHLKRSVGIFAEIGEPDVMEPAIWKLVEW